mgnify:CR=1 FL=1
MSRTTIADQVAGYEISPRASVRYGGSEGVPRLGSHGRNGEDVGGHDAYDKSMVGGHEVDNLACTGALTYLIPQGFHCCHERIGRGVVHKHGCVVQLLDTPAHYGDVHTDVHVLPLLSRAATNRRTMSLLLYQISHIMSNTTVCRILRVW